MITTVNEIIRILRTKFNIVVPENVLVLLDLTYSYKLPVATTQLDTLKRIDDTLIIKFKTSFGIFHQDKLDYNDIMVVLFENVNGSLSDLRHDLIISELTYPTTQSRRSISCGQ